VLEEFTWRDRVKFAGLAALGLLLIGLNLSAMTHGEFFPKALILSLPITWAGFWLTIFPPPKTQGPFPKWWFIGAVAVPGLLFITGGLISALLV